MIDIFRYEENGIPSIRMSEKDFQAYTAEITFIALDKAAKKISPRSKNKK